ncbi:hypothetical protein ACFWMP_19350 [Paenibacillus sp. NPDC058367]|uniref:hypothetical protein n=1 Tax=Paenibacillus sp. NPDC058367 TaxID=3346460 RepID=UPI003653D1B2
MRSIDKPAYTTEFVYKTCISEVKRKQLKKTLEACIPEIIKVSDRYELLGEKGLLYTLKDNTCVNLAIDKKHLIRVYTTRMVDKDQPGRSIYNELLSHTPHSMCPICSQRRVSSIDHYLPKSLFPSLAVAPINLIPACDQCNKKKLDEVALTYENSTLHPYFDDFLSERFLFAEVIESVPPVIRFFVDPPNNWDESLKKRVRNHFTFFQLNELYSVHAAEEITAQVDVWFDLDAKERRGFFLKQARSREKKNPNSWQVAMYDGLAASRWFCEEGFNKF